MDERDSANEFFKWLDSERSYAIKESEELAKKIAEEERRRKRNRRIQLGVLGGLILAYIPLSIGDFLYKKQLIEENRRLKEERASCITLPIGDDETFGSISHRIRLYFPGKNVGDIMAQNPGFQYYNDGLEWRALGGENVTYCLK